MLTKRNEKNCATKCHTNDVFNGFEMQCDFILFGMPPTPNSIVLDCATKI